MLSVHQIRKAYYHRPVLKSITFDLQLGEVVGILGKNGAGKSTLLRMIAGISSIDRGSILIRDEPIQSGNINPRKSLFYLGHAPGLYPNLSAIENIKLVAALRNVNLDNHTIMQTLQEMQLDNQAQDSIKVYSQGMLQRLKLALCDLLEWDLLLIDEPFSGLDAQGVSFTQDKLNSWASPEKLIIWVVHDMDWALSHCSRILVIQNGEIGLDKTTRGNESYIQSYYEEIMS